MTIFVKNKHTLEIEEFKFKCCIGKRVQQVTKKKVIRKHPKEHLKLAIFIIEKIAKKNHQQYLNVSV